MAEKPIAKSFSSKDKEDPWKILRETPGVKIISTAKKEPGAHKYG